MKRKETARVISQNEIAAGIMSLRLAVTFTDEMKAGQFVSLFSKDGSRLLPRPISVCETNREEGTIRLVYRIAGTGTKEFSMLQPGDTVEVLGPQGNGFPLEECTGRRVLLIGGGIGIPPMLSCAKGFAELPEEKRPAAVAFAAGYRSDDTYLLEELQEQAPVYVSSDDGAIGTHGTVLDAMKANNAEADVIFACGPKPMLRALKAYAQENGIDCWLSMEERMACGVGVCLGCVTKTAETDGHSHVKNARVCCDGPVFRAEKLDLS
ncbi:MAG: dihydroorotate dehydrogenase electron transfer subunit [Lachnospiraceae bacterium]|nr:dihydroorotate dehydrogenase electron transfer subunit [Lachnospiraceae bacterium]